MTERHRPDHQPQNATRVARFARLRRSLTRSTGPGRAEMTSIIRYIYNEYLKEEQELAKKEKENVRKKLDLLRNGDTAGTRDGQKKG